MTGFEPGLDEHIHLKQKHHDEKILLKNINEPIHCALTARQYGNKYKPRECENKNLTVVNIQQANINTLFIIVMFDFGDRV